MKAYLHYDAYYEVDMPDININTKPWQDALTDKKRYVEESLPDEFILEFLGVVGAD